MTVARVIPQGQISEGLGDVCGKTVLSKNHSTDESLSTLSEKQIAC